MNYAELEKRIAEAIKDDKGGHPPSLTGRTIEPPVHYWPMANGKMLVMRGTKIERVDESPFGKLIPDKEK